MPYHGGGKSVFSGIFKRCKQCTNRFVVHANRTVFCSTKCEEDYEWFEQERANRFRRESMTYFCSHCGNRYSSREEMQNHQHDFNKEEFEYEFDKETFTVKVTPASSLRVKAVIELILRGDTEGERMAAKAAYKRLTGKEYK